LIAVIFIALPSVIGPAHRQEVEQIVARGEDMLVQQAAGLGVIALLAEGDQAVVLFAGTGIVVIREIELQTQVTVGIAVQLAQDVEAAVTARRCARASR